MTSKIVYTGNLHTTAVHIASGQEIATDAPVDNGGNGAAFSPTDLVATALASCMLTIMGKAAATQGINIDGTSVEITKHMGTDPRMIVKIDAFVNVKSTAALNEKHRSILEHAARTCPVLQSLHPDLDKNIFFEYI